MAPELAARVAPAAKVKVSPAGPPNATAAVERMRLHGLAKLAVSDCVEAEWWFTSAMKLLDEINVTVNTTWNPRRQLVGDRGFALVCAQRFDEGADLLEKHMQYSGVMSSPPHLINALGYAQYRLQDFSRADSTFAVGTRADPLNPILWNNLAAAKMVSGPLTETSIREADDALFHAMNQQVENSYDVDEYHRHVFRANVQNLVNRLTGVDSELPLPAVELWWGGE